MDQTYDSQTAGVYTCGVPGQEAEATVTANGEIASKSSTFNFWALSAGTTVTCTLNLI